MDKVVFSKENLATLNDNELAKICNNAKVILNERIQQRKKELWGNICAAINKYLEIEDISLVDDYGLNKYLVKDAVDLSEVGVIKLS